MGWRITTLVNGLLIFLNPSTRAASWIGILVVLGVGQGMLVNSLSCTVQALADNQDVAYASALYAFMRTLGLAFGVALGGTIFQNRLSSNLHLAGLPTAISIDAEGYLHTL
jgi:predicted MFS family arabinose efflux permease